MIDSCNRNIDYIRISVTDRCNLRCIYCMPEEGVKCLSHKDILTYEEIIRLCSTFTKLGIKKIKITGGEPLVRRDIADLIGWIKCLKGIENVSLTTNGVKLKEQLPGLVKNGLDGVNISLDTLSNDNFERITRFDVLPKVLEGIEKALTYPNLKVKVNCVPMQNTKESDLIEIAGLAKDSRLSVRFIEMMPIGLGKDFNHFSEERIISILSRAYGPLEKYDEVLGNGPAHYYAIPGFTGKIGFISAITHQFCGDCNRVRLTADGYLKTCLHYDHGTDLKSLLRAKVDDKVLETVIRNTIYNKPTSHNFSKYIEEGPYEMAHMSKIGG